MKITNISTVVVNARMRNWIFVKVETDQPGLAGWGEATLEWKTKGVVGAIEDLSVLIMGQDPRRIEHLWQTMHRQYFWRGGITDMTALSGIDQALWDIKGKELGKPVCELLGGPVRDTLRFYDHLGGGSLEGMYKTLEPEEFGARMEQSIAAGFTAVKAMPIPVSELIESPRTLKHAARSVEAMRKAGGDGVDIMLDLHARCTTAAAIQFGRLLTDYNLYWYEEPCWHEHVDGLADVARALPFPIATGERLTGSLAIPRAVRETRLRHRAARCLPLRRHQRSTPHRRHGGDLHGFGGVPQPHGAGGYGCFTPRGLCHPELLDSGGGTQRCALARRYRDRTHRHGRRPRPSALVARVRHRDQRKGSGQAPLRARSDHALFPSRRVGRGLVASHKVFLSVRSTIRWLTRSSPSGTV